MKKLISKSIDVEPKWEGLAPLFCNWLECGTEDQKDHAKKEIMRMAIVCDKIREAQKKGVQMVRVNNPKGVR